MKFLGFAAEVQEIKEIKSKAMQKMMEVFAKSPKMWDEHQLGKKRARAAKEHFQKGEFQL